MASESTVASSQQTAAAGKEDDPIRASVLRERGGDGTVKRSVHLSNAAQLTEFHQNVISRLSGALASVIREAANLESSIKTLSVRFPLVSRGDMGNFGDMLIFTEFYKQFRWNMCMYVFHNQLNGPINGLVGMDGILCDFNP